MFQHKSIETCRSIDYTKRLLWHIILWDNCGLVSYNKTNKWCKVYVLKYCCVVLLPYISAQFAHIWIQQNMAWECYVPTAVPVSNPDFWRDECCYSDASISLEHATHISR